MKPCRNNNDILANGNHESLYLEIIFFRGGLHVHFYGNIGQGFATSAGGGSSLRQYSRKKL